MTGKKRNNGKRQFSSIDDKELYETYMRNHDEYAKRIHEQIDSYLEAAFQDKTQSVYSDGENGFDEELTLENFDVRKFIQIEDEEKERIEQYVDKFMVDADFTTRPRKQIYIREDTHERIMKLVKIVGKGQVSMSSYIDNIINEHFNVHAAEIKAAFEEGIKAYRI